MDSEFDHKCRGNESRLAAVKMVAERFIAQHYAKESPSFDVFWQVLSPKISEALSATRTEGLAIGFPRQLVEAVSLARDISLDLVTPIVMGTIGETLWELKDEQPDPDTLRQLVASSASRLGASPSLTACLIDHVPALLTDILARKRGDKDAIVGEAPPPQYSIWTAGRHIVAESIAKYENKRDRYLFWLDLNETSHVSHHSPKKRIGPQAIRLLMYLVEDLGVVRSAEDLYERIWDLSLSKLDNPHISAIEQQLTRLHQFSGGKFRANLLRGQSKGYGLRESFADQYFIFKRIR